MTVIGFVLIKVKTEKEYFVFNALKSENKIDECYPIFSEFDFLAKITAKDMQELQQIVIDNIRTIDGIVDTKTLMGICYDRIKKDR
ncbi:Lrp/AsnC ligand binding domain-containing protein [Sulfuricurvum sp.]|uniref:Lrp/AsnC ligand binding domain-containing protein n=1 Tax=Sulfuricurvum sp. TaxID=2025608 RepID=UPI00356B5BD4